MSKKEIYIVTMYRYGDRESHSYVLGVWDKKAQATKYGQIEESWRGGKYMSEVLPVEINREVNTTDEEIKKKTRRWYENGAPTDKYISPFNSRFGETK